MLKLTGLTLNANLSGRVEIYAADIVGPRYYGATSRKQLVIMGGEDSENMLIAEDQIIQVETL